MAKAPDSILLSVTVEVELAVLDEETMTPYEIADNEKSWIKKAVEDALIGRVTKIAVRPVIK